MTFRPCRWGILSTAGIAKKNWRAIRRCGTATLVAVASRRQAQAEQFITECQAFEPFDPKPEAIQGYETLLNREDIDAVYIPLPTGLRKEWILQAARAGKHILSEKPAGLSAKEVMEILDTCEENQVQYMDGVMFMHSRRMDALRNTLHGDSQIGSIRRIASQFSFPSDESFRQTNIRVMSQLEPFGSLGDLGWYNVRMILWLLKWKKPKMVIGRTLQSMRGEGSQTSVPSEFSGELFFDDGVSATFYCSFTTCHQQWIHISGDKGFVSIPDFVLPYHGSQVRFDLCNNQFLIDGCDFNMEEHREQVAVSEYSSGRESAQEVNMFRTFSDLVTSKAPDSKWGQMTLATQQVMDALFWSSTNESAPTPIAGAWM